jgi:hypothetical protein
MLCFANFTAYFHTVRRYMVGLHGRMLRPISWEPPGTWMFWVPVYAIALAALVILVMRLSSGEAADHGLVADDDLPVRRHLIGQGSGPQEAEVAATVS